MSAELMADGGGAAAQDEFFRSPEFLAAEGATHTLRAGGALVPLIVREVPGSGDYHDAVSPYGYPGASLPDGAAVWATELADPASGLVSIFVRDRLDSSLAGGTERSRVQVHDPASERRVRPRLDEQVRANERDGWEVVRRPGPEATAAEREAFHAAYTQTMQRAQASERYLYEPGYFEAILGFEDSWLLLATAGGDPGAGAIVARSDSYLHYYLGGTADVALAASPFKNVVTAMLDLADELELPLNLGGGVEAGDGLEQFKRGFANASAPFVTHEIVCDAEAYAELTPPAATGRFFPAYRDAGL